MKTSDPTLQIPPDAMPVVLVLRKDVPRPDPDKLKVTSDGCRWINFCIWRCPMGLHPDSSDSIPSWSEDFAGGCCKAVEVEALWRWWDPLTLPEAKQAFDLIWPESKVNNAE